MAVNTHKVEIVPVRLEKHPDAETLSLVHVYGWQVVTKTADWLALPPVNAEAVAQGESPVWLGAYVQPDSIVDVTRPEFSFLRRSPEDGKPHRVRVIRLRKALSQGLLLPAPEGAQLGDDVAEQLGVRHYEPPTQEELEHGGSHHAESYTGPQIWVPHYDVESMYRYVQAFREGELVDVSEKIHGQNTKFMFDGERMWAGTRREWVKPDMGSPWVVLNTHPWIEDFCHAHPLCILFGETYGWVQVLRYGAWPNEYWFRAFDVLEGTQYWSVSKFRKEIPQSSRVPDWGIVEFDFERLKELAEGDTMLEVTGNTNKQGKGGKPIANMREGIVVRPLEERYEHDLGRVILKLVSNTYLETVKEPEAI
ncbi:MAG TPA: RNA ligase family protein [Nitrospira sp.]|nr:RNA ligase family protein [Nitrospira sp.]